jgi:hypothetical protein
MSWLEILEPKPWTVRSTFWHRRRNREFAGTVPERKSIRESRIPTDRELSCRPEDLLANKPCFYPDLVTNNPRIYIIKCNYSGWKVKYADFPAKTDYPGRAWHSRGGARSLQKYINSFCWV